MSNREAFVKGTITLALANAAVKLIGALYTIPLARLIGADGMGLYASAYQIYSWLFILSTTGIPIAISKMVSEEIALRNYCQAHKIFKTALIILTSIGILSSLLLYFTSGLILDVIGTERAYLCLLSISPCLFFVAVMSAFRGYFQGMQNMMPTASSQLTEALIKASAGIFLAYLFIEKGIEYSAAGAIAGVSLGGFLGMILLLILYGIKRKNILHKIELNKFHEKSSNIIKTTVKLIKISLPITIGASVFAISGIIDLAMIMRRLKEIGFSEMYAIKLYGYLTGYAYKIFNLPTSIVIALAVSIVPIISSCFARRNMNSVRRISNASMKLALMFSIPAAVGVAILAKPILILLFNDSSAANLLVVLSFSIVFVALIQVTGSILQGMGYVILPVKNLLIGAAVKVCMNYFLVGIPRINILGAPIATGICYSIVVALNFNSIKRVLHIKYDILNIFLKPLAASAVMGISIYYLYNSLIFITKMNSISTLISILSGILIYLSAMILLNGINQNDFKLLPFGEKISKYLFKLKIFG